LRVAISSDVEEPRVARVVNIERGMNQSKRTIVVLSSQYLADHWTNSENILGQSLGIDEGRCRILPVSIGAIDRKLLPTRLAMLTILKMAEQPSADKLFQLEKSLRHQSPRCKIRGLLRPILCPASIDGMHDVKIYL